MTLVECSLDKVATDVCKYLQTRKSLFRGKLAAELVRSTTGFSLPAGYFSARKLICGALVLSASTCNAQSAKFQLALPGYAYQFPRDHGAHTRFATEWWYYTGHLRDAKNQRFGYQLTFFRTSLSPSPTKRASKWSTNEVMFAHFALTDENGNRFFFDDRIARGAAGIAGAQSANSKRAPRIWLGDWNLQFSGASGQNQHIRARGTFRAKSDENNTVFALDLKHSAAKFPTTHGTNGVSQKSAGRGRASHYYSFTRLNSRGTLRIGDKQFRVDGESWFDHEWGSSQLAPNQTGWDWFSLQLGDGRELMLYQLRLRGGGTDPFSSGTLVERDGRKRHLRRADFRIEPTRFWRSEQSGGNYPAAWNVSVPSANLRLQIAPKVAAQELNTRRSTGISYWEGLVRATGKSGSKTVAATGYVELTGYARAFGSTF